MTQTIHTPANMKKKRALSNSRDPFYIAPNTKIAPGRTYQDAVDEASQALADEIDREVPETLRKQNAGAQLQS